MGIDIFDGMRLRLMRGYVFVSNSTKPTIEKANSREKVIPTNVSRPCLQAALNLGYSVIWGINKNRPEEIECDLPIKLYDSHTYRSVFAIKDNYIALKNLDRVIKNNDVEVIHCNTPIGGLVGRICGRKNKVKHVIYTVHGFHFYKGAPLINNVLYKSAEKIMARWTDAIITMNQEDFETAKTFKIRKGGKVFKVHGVGISLSEYDDFTVDKSKKREELGLKDSDLICVSAGDLVSRKNYEIAIEAVARSQTKNLHYIICGNGQQKESLIQKAKCLKVDDRIHFLGFRTDIKEIMRISDFFLFTSLQEGLPRSLMEAMALGMPVVVSNIRGNVDLIHDGEGGYLVNPYDADGFALAIDCLCQEENKRMNMGKVNREEIKKYDIAVVEKEILDIYKEIGL